MDLASIVEDTMDRILSTDRQMDKVKPVYLSFNFIEVGSIKKGLHNRYIYWMILCCIMSFLWSILQHVYFKKTSAFPNLEASKYKFHQVPCLNAFMKYHFRRIYAKSFHFVCKGHLQSKFLGWNIDWNIRYTLIWNIHDHQITRAPINVKKSKWDMPFCSGQLLYSLIFKT